MIQSIIYRLYMIQNVQETFGKHTFLINGLVQGIKGLLSFLAAPLIGALRYEHNFVWGLCKQQFQKYFFESLRDFSKMAYSIFLNKSFQEIPFFI